MRFLTDLKSFLIKVWIIIFDSVLDGRMVWLIALDEDFGGLVAAIGTSDDLIDELISAFGG